MSAEVKILVQGKTNVDSVAETGSEETISTITLIKDGDLILIVDPGVLESQEILIEALKKEGLRAEDVDIVCITHSHIDHYRNIGMFPNAKTLEYYGLWNKTSVENWSEHFTPNIQILLTPGHDHTGITLLVKTNIGVVAVCGDIFWKENYPKKPEDDVFASDPEKLSRSRELILKIADWIVPGHGGMYKNNKGELSPEAENTAAKEKKIFAVCRKCRRIMENKRDSCRCRPFLCHYCCECGMDCDLCNCSHLTGGDIRKKDR